MPKSKVKKFMMVVGGLLLVLWLIFPPVVHGQISQVQGWCSLPPPLYDQCLSNPFVGMSEPYVCQIMPYDLNNQPLFSGISYDWGISSNGSLGRFDIQDDGRVGRFFPMGAGEGTIFVNLIKSEQVIGEKSFPVSVDATRQISKVKGLLERYGQVFSYAEKPISSFPGDLPCCYYYHEYIRCCENKSDCDSSGCFVYSVDTVFSPCDKTPDFTVNGLDFAKLLLEER